MGGSFEHRTVHEFEDESLLSPHHGARKTQLDDIVENDSFSGYLPNDSFPKGSPVFHDKRIIRNSVYNSIKTVVFSTKLNLLMPFGPLAIVVSNWNGHNIPFCVVIGWMMGRSMDLNFQLFETATLFITVIVVAFFLQEGTSNYFKGLMIILCYLIVAASFFGHEDNKKDNNG